MTCNADSIKSTKGFSLIEILVVLAILSILVMMALPKSDGKIDRTRIQESLKLVEGYKSSIEAHYRMSGEFPTDNESAGIPDAEHIIGNYLAETELQDGALHLVLGNKINQQLQGKVISIRPTFVAGVDNAPISWVCGYDTIPEGMVVAGENRTNVETMYLPLVCR